MLIRRELEEAAKVLGERIRTGDASAEVQPGRAPAADSGAVPEWMFNLLPSTTPPQHHDQQIDRCRHRNTFSGSQDYFELGVILLRKKLFTQATKNLEKAKKSWTGEPEELAQVTRLRAANVLDGHVSLDAL